MEQVVAGILCMLLVFVLFPLLWWRRRQASASSHEHEDDSQPLQADRVVRQPRASRMRRRPVAATSSSVASTSTEDALIESEEDALEDENLVVKASTKKEKKKQEREAQRQAEEASRESRKSKQDFYAEMRRKKDEEREAEERRMEEEAMVRKAKEEEASALEFDKWKGEFSVDAEGTTTENEMQDEKQSLLSNFVEYIKKQKCVPLEDLAAEFKLRTQDCINRITTLESMGRLSGVMDDRGKYVYISPEEMKAVADYIKREGRVSISHLASRSNQFIDLDPKPQFEVEHGSEGITVS